MAPPRSAPSRALVFGATGTIGRATVTCLVGRGYEVVCFVRAPAVFEGASVRVGQVTDGRSVARDAFAGERFDAVVSCLASRTGVPADAWSVDHDAHCHILDAAQRAGVGHMVLLSAICVQRPRLAFQHAKLAFERRLIGSGLTYSIVRPTAYFKSLSGQIERLRRGEPFLMFGDGERTACKPISDRDLAAFLADCLTDPDKHDRILPIGGPGKPVTPRQQAEWLFALLGRQPRFRRLPVAALDAVILALSALGGLHPNLRAKAELARIGRYYGTESMLLLDDASGEYDGTATPSTGSDTLFDHYARLVAGVGTPGLGPHAVW